MHCASSTNFSFQDSENVFADTKVLVADVSFYPTDCSESGCCLKEKALDIQQVTSGRGSTLNVQYVQFK